MRVYCSLAGTIGRKPSSCLITRLASVISSHPITFSEDELVLVRSGRRDMVRFIDRHYGLIIKPGERGHYNGIYLRVAQSDDVWPEIINCLDSRRGALMRRFSERQTVTDVSAALPTRMLDNRPLVLAAVDLPENRLAAKSVLESRSRLTLVNDAVSALQLMISKRFDLVYLQFSLPASLDKVESRLFWLSQQRQSGNLAMVQAGGHGFGLASIFRGVSYRLRK